MLVGWIAHGSFFFGHLLDLVPTLWALNGDIMFSIFCKECGSSVVYDPLRSLEHYKADLEEKEIIPSKLEVFSYLIYACSGCGLEFRYTFQDVERMERERLTELVESQLRSAEKKVRAPIGDERIYCGGCSGMGNGYCVLAIYLKCDKAIKSKDLVDGG